MTAKAAARDGGSRSMRAVIERELADVCGTSAQDVLDLALMFASQSSVPVEAETLRAFLLGELKQTLARVEGQDAADSVCGKLAMQLLERSGKYRIAEEPKLSISRMKAALSAHDARCTTRPRSSHTQALSLDHEFPASVEALLETVNIEFKDPEVQAARHPVLVLSEFPQPAEEIQQVLRERVEVYHHHTLDFFESDLLILAARHPVVVLDCRGQYTDFCERFLTRADPDLALLVWGRDESGELPGRRMVTCLANTNPTELAMLIDIFLPKYR